MRFLSGLQIRLSKGMRIKGYRGKKENKGAQENRETWGTWENREIRRNGGIRGAGK